MRGLKPKQHVQVPTEARAHRFVRKIKQPFGVDVKHTKSVSFDSGQSGMLQDDKPVRTPYTTQERPSESMATDDLHRPFWFILGTVPHVCV